MITYKVILTKIESNHSRLRTSDVLGNTLELPQVGKSFYLVGESLTEGMIARVVTTSEISSVEVSEDGKEFTFKTQNSTYKVQVLGTEEVE